MKTECVMYEITVQVFNCKLSSQYTWTELGQGFLALEVNLFFHAPFRLM